MVDYDEAIVGLMAKHWHNAKEFPFYFYGQQYGFTFVETSIISLSYYLLPITDYAVKLPMLLLFSIGIICFYKTLTQLNTKHKYLPLLITILFLLSPAWAVWSLKARGGYLTAFLFTSIIMYLLLKKQTRNPNITYLLIGFLTIIIYQAQPLWIPGLAVFIIYKLFINKNICTLLSTASGTLSGIIMFIILHRTTTDYSVTFWWHPDVFNIHTNILTELKHLPGKLYTNLCGSYYLTNIFAPTSIFINIFAYTFTLILLFMLLTSAILFIYRRNKTNPLIFITTIAIIATIIPYLITTDHAPRYLLPITALAMLLFFLMLNEYLNTTIQTIIILFFTLSGSIAMCSYTRYTFDESNKAELQNMLTYLERNKIHATFSCDWLLQWHVMFYSQEDIISRYTLTPDRYPKYIKTVNDAYNTDATHTAIIGFANQLPPGKNTISFGNTYYVYPNPSLRLLDSLGFQMK